MYMVFYLENCPYSEGAVELLKEKNLEHKLIIFSSNLNKDNATEKSIQELDDKKYFINKEKLDKRIFKDYFGEDSTFPRIYLDTNLVGGYSDLVESFKSD